MNKVTNLLVAALFFMQSLVFAESNFPSSSFEVQRVKITFTTPQGYVRYLTIGFTPSNIATDGFDYGFDTAVVMNYDDDLNWLIDDSRYIIQGVGSFNEAKKYPMGMFLTHSGEIKIDLISLENFDSEIDVFIYDSLEDSYTRINEAKFIKEMPSGDYIDRFYIAFQEPIANQQNATLSTNDQTINDSSINFLPNPKTIIIDAASNNILENVSLYNIGGQKIFSNNYNNIDRATINTISFSSGIYIVNAKTNHGITTKKLVIH